jgi:hypothetical protein
MTAMLLQVANVHDQHEAGTREVWAVMRDRFASPFRDEVDAMAARAAQSPTPAPSQLYSAPGPPQTPLATRPPS